MDDLRAGDGGAGLRATRRRPRLGDLQGDVLLAEQRLRDDRAGDVGRDLSDLVGVDAQRQLGPSALASKSSTSPTITPRILTSARLGQLEPDLGGLQRDLVVVGELLGEDRVGHPHAEQQQARGRARRGSCGSGQARIATSPRQPDGGGGAPDGHRQEQVDHVDRPRCWSGPPGPRRRPRPRARREAV